MWAQKRTFVYFLNNVCDFFLSQLPSYIKGDMVSMQIYEEVYFASLEEHKNNLHGYILFTRGDKSLTHLDLCQKT